MPSLSRFPGELGRREVLRLIAAGGAAALAGCSKPDQPIFPAADTGGEGGPQNDPGAIRRYATTLTLGGYGRGVTGLVVDARPIKIEGNPRHPASLGATDLFAEAAILDLYDPQRLRAPIGPAGISGWSLLERALIARLAGSDGRDVRLLTGRITSPSLLARVADLGRRYPGLRHVRAEAIDDDAERAGTKLAFGRPLAMRPRWAEARVVVALDADPLGPGPEQVAHARGWADRRRGGPLRLYAFEPSMTLTGAAADRRAAATPGQAADVLLAIAHALGADVAVPPLPPIVQRRAAEAIADLARARGAAFVLVGRGQAPAVHALAAWVNAELRAPVDRIAPVDTDPEPHADSLAALAEEMHAGHVGTLMMLDTNPLLFAAPVLGMREAIGRVPLSVAATRFPDETSGAATWSVPLSDPLESWGDSRAPDGTAGIAQPLVRPFYRTRDAFAMLDLLDPVGVRPGYVHVRDAWRAQATGDYERWWRDALVAGVVPGSAAQRVAAPDARFVGYAPSAAGPPLVVTLAPSATLWDGRYATNAWAQECPDPLTKEVWGAGLRMHPADAARAELADGDPVRVGAAGVTTVRIVAGQARGIATLPLGGGRRASGAIAGEEGANGFALRARAGGWLAAPAIARAPHGPTPIATQALFALAGETAKLFPVVASGGAVPRGGPLPSLLPPRQPSDAAPAQWAMAIDTSVCIGCNACVVACQAENNVPPIGPDQMARGRDMHWLRVDRYDTDEAAADDPKPGFQPVPCMQCEAAPCEPVCPVEASVHDHQGLNVQVYNRCIGTRTCQANCPYKVRRFNFLDYAGDGLWGDELDQASVSAQRNPQVTVRARGVMEKCTYCVQRISAAVREADASGAPLGEVRTACQSACPTQAIVFGDLAGAPIAAARADPRHYALLEELGTKPRTTYLAKVRDT